MTIGVEDNHPRCRVSVLDTEISFVDVGEGMVLAVHGGPLPRPDASGDPSDDPEAEGERTAQRHTAMGRGAVQVDGGAEVRDLTDDETSEDGEEKLGHAEADLTRRS